MTLLLISLLQIVPSSPDVAATIRHAAGDFFADGWQPYVVELHNLASVEKNVEVQIRDVASEGFARKRERLAPGVRRRVFLYLPTPRNLHYLGIQYRVLSEGDLRPVGWSDTLNSRNTPQPPKGALLCRDGDSMEAFRLSPQAVRTGQEFGRFSTASLPDKRIGLDPFQALIAHDPAWDEFTIDQARALGDWVRRGGRLILSPGPRADALAHPLLRDIVEIESDGPTHVKELEFPGTGLRVAAEEAFAIHRPRNGEASAYGRRFRAGLGQVLVLPVDVRRAPFASWSGLPRLWNGILSDGAGDPFSLGERSLLNDVSIVDVDRTVLALRQRISPFPSFPALLALLLAFILILGPLNYGILRRIGAPLLSVLTLPVLSFLLLGLLAAGGRLQRGIGTVRSTARIVHARPGERWAAETTLVSLFAPSGREYRLAAPPGSALLPLGWEAWRGASMPVHAETSATGVSLENVPLAQGQSRAFAGAALRDLGGGLRFTMDPATRRAGVENGSGLALTACLLLDLRARTLARLGPVGPGARAEAAVEDHSESRTHSLRDLMGVDPDRLAAALLPASPTRLPARPVRLLVALAEDPGPGVEVDAPLSSRSEGALLILVPEEIR